MPENKHKTTLNLRIDWSEMDLYGHINNVAFMKYVQAGRMEFWEQLGLASKPDETGLGFVLASTHCDFKASLFYPGNVKIITELDFLKNTSMGLKHTIYNDAAEVAAEARDVLVIFDYTNRKKMPVPDWVREKLE